MKSNDNVPNPNVTVLEWLNAEWKKSEPGAPPATAHAGNNGFYLDSAHRVDQYLEELWSFVEADPEYRGHTTLIFLPDHGRGDAPEQWKDHGQKIPDSKYIFLAAIGVGVPARGELGAGTPAVTQSQVAVTIAQLFGMDWNKQTPQAGKPLPNIKVNGIGSTAQQELHGLSRIIPAQKIDKGIGSWRGLAQKLEKIAYQLDSDKYLKMKTERAMR